MQLITVASTALFVAAASANSAAYKGAFDPSKPYVKVFNKCGSPLYAWSISKGLGCPSDQATEIKDGDFYAENYRETTNSGDAISIKFSWDKAGCDGQNITQVEYCRTPTGPYKANYVDISYVNCGSGDCPSRKTGFHYKVGNQDDGKGGVMYATDSWNNCPVISCSSAEECAKYAYVKYNDDFATRSCDPNANWEVYLCDPAGPNGHSKPSSSPAPAPSSKSEEEKKPSTTAAAAKEAVVTPAPAPEDAKTKYETVVVTQTAYQYVEVEAERKAKRHAHAHQHQHRRFHA